MPSFLLRSVYIEEQTVRSGDRLISEILEPVTATINRPLVGCLFSWAGRSNFHAVKKPYAEVRF
jgi:hypothetical protein